MTEITEVPSPFCGIGTDDLSIQVDGATLKVIANGCPVNTPAFEQAIADTSPRIAGQPVSLEAATSKAAELLRGTHQPVIGGCAADVNGMRALLALADKTGAVVDNINFNAARRNLLAMQDSGWMNTTLAEVKNRCDLLLIIGTDPEAFAPRFFEHFLWNEQAMFLDSTDQREVIFLGKTPAGHAATSPSGKKPTVLACDDADLPDVVAALLALVKNQPLQAEAIGNVTLAQLGSIADKLREARYGVVLWSAGKLAFEHAELTVQTICNIVKEINMQNTRCSGLPLGGKEGDYTANQVCGWTTGYPARVNFARGYPEYDPFVFDSQVMIANGEADAVVWVHAFNATATPPQTELPTVVIGRSGMQFEREPDVFIPVGTPGIDHAGHTYRMDSVVALRLKKLRDAGLPSTAEVLIAIEQAI
jgi:formylmethanofuran dehydrogenase subunit B